MAPATRHHEVAIISTAAQARAAEEAGADVIVTQGMEACGHRGCFDAADAEREQVGLFALLPAVVDAVKVAVVATDAIAGGRGVAAALTLGASAAGRRSWTVRKRTFTRPGRRRSPPPRRKPGRCES